MKRPRRIIIISSLAMLGIVVMGWTWTWGQAKAAPVTPLSLVPAGTVLLISADADALHKEAWEKTAAYEAFQQSGLLDSLTKLVHEVFEHAPEEGSRAVLQFVEFVAEHGLTVSIGLPEGDGPALPYLTLVAHDAGTQANTFAKTFGPPIKVTRQKISTRMVSRIMLPEAPGVELAWWVEGKHLVITLGNSAVDSAISVADGKSPSFAGSAAGKKLTAKPTFDRTCVVWLDATILRDRFGDIPLPTEDPKTVADVLEVLGLNSLNHVFVQSGYKGSALWTTIDVDAPGPRKGLLGLADPETSTMTLKDLPLLPSGCAGFAAQSFSLIHAYDQILETAHAVAKLGPPDASEQLDELLAQMPEFLGFDLREDLLAPLGSIQCFYSDSTQGVLFADYGLLLQVKDAEKLRETVVHLLESAAQEIPEEVLSSFQQKKHGQDLITLQFGGGVFNPSFVVDENWLCIGLTPQTTEAFAMRLKGELPSWKPDEETVEALAAAPKKFASISVAYPRQSIRGLVAAAPVLLGAAQTWVTQMGRFGQMPPFDLMTTALDLPPAELVVRPLFPNVSWSVIDESGFHMTSRNSAPTIPLTGGPNVSSIAAVALLGGTVLPFRWQAAGIAPRRAQSKNNLKQIGLALHNFESTYRQFPQGTIPSKTLKPEERQSWMIQILPFIDQAAMYNQMNVNLKDSAEWDDEALQASNRVVIPTYENPEHAGRGFLPGEPATTDYAGWAGVGKDAPTEKAKANKKGIFGYDRATRFADITDGSSNTIMVSEVITKDRGPWAQGGPSTIRALTDKPYVNGKDGIGGAKPDGFNALLGDGSVRFISQNVDAAVLEALATRAGGEVINDY